MDPEPKAGNGSPGVHLCTGLEISEAALFAIVWDALADVLGTAAAAVVVRRAVRQAATERPDLIGLVIVRKDFEYRYSLPAAWEHKAEHEPAALRVLVREVVRVLRELTGTLVVRRLEQIPELRAHGLICGEGEKTE